MPKPEQSKPTYTAEDLELARMIIESESPASYPSVPPELLSSQPIPEPAPPPPPIVGKPWSDEEQILRDARKEADKKYKRYFGPPIDLQEPGFKRRSLEAHHKQTIPELHDGYTEAEAPGVVATESVPLPAMQPEEEATAAADEEVAPTPEVPAVTVPGSGALAKLGANAVAQAEQRAELHKLEAGRRMDEAEAREAAQKTKQGRIVDWKEKLGRLEDELQYFGMDRDDVHAAQALLEKEPEPNWTMDERQNLLRKQALAKAQLQSARTINTMGPFKHMASKFLAALSVGAGSWAAVRTGRNPAMELYKGAIERDIAAQKSASVSYTHLTLPTKA